MAKAKKRSRAVDDILYSLHELAQALEEGAPLEEWFTVRTVGVPEPGKYYPAALKSFARSWA